VLDVTPFVFKHIINVKLRRIVYLSMIDALSSKHSMKIQFNGYKIARAHLSPEHTETNTTYSSASDDKSSILVLNFALLGEFETTTNELHETKEQNPFVSAKFAGFRDIPDAHITCKALEGQKNHGTNSNEPRQLQSDASFS
jgi:hypothetical protein